MLEWWKKFKCKWFHKQDHVCWDDLARDYGGVEHWPGDLCYFCNRCKRSWHKPNPHKFPSGCPERGPWAEYRWPERLLISYNGTPDFIRGILLKVRNRKYGNTTESSRTSPDDPVSDGTGPDGPDSSGEHSSVGGSAGDGNCSSSV